MMKRTARLLCLTTMTTNLVFSSVTFAEDQLALKPLALPGLITEALARNPEILAARQQWEAAAKRVPQARSLDDPTLSVQWWNAPESFNLGGPCGEHAHWAVPKIPLSGKTDSERRNCHSVGRDD